MKFFKKKEAGSGDLPVPVQEISRLRSQNMTNSQIVQYLQNEGYKSHEIFRALKEAERVSSEKDYRELSDAPSDSLFGSLPKIPSDFQNSNNIFSNQSQGQGDVAPPEGLDGSVPVDQGGDVGLNGDFSQGLDTANNNFDEGLPVDGSPNSLSGESEGFVGGQEKNFDLPPEENDGLNKDFVSFNSDPDVEKIEEIAESIIDEKWRDFMDSVRKIVVWKDRTEQRMRVIEERFEDMKKSFDSMQAAVTKKIEVYDKNVAEVNTGVRAMEQVFQKVLPKLTDNVNELSRITKKVEDQKIGKKKKKPTPD